MFSISWHTPLAGERRAQRKLSFAGMSATRRRSWLAGSVAPSTCNASRQILLGSPLVKFLERLSTLRATTGLRMNGGGYSAVSPRVLLRSRRAIGRRELDFKLMDLIPLGIRSLTLRYRQKLLQASAGGHRLWFIHGRIISSLDKSPWPHHRWRRRRASRA